MAKELEKQVTVTIVEYYDDIKNVMAVKLKVEGGALNPTATNEYDRGPKNLIVPKGIPYSGDNKTYADALLAEAKKELKKQAGIPAV